MPQHHVLLLLIGKNINTGYTAIAEIKALMPDDPDLDIHELLSQLVDEDLMRAPVENTYEVTDDGKNFIRDYLAS